MINRKHIFHRSCHVVVSMLVVTCFSFSAPVLAETESSQSAITSAQAVEATVMPDVLSVGSESDESTPQQVLGEGDSARIEAGEQGTLELTDAKVSSTLPQDLSPWGMFMAADWIVKLVIISLAFASLLTWTILVSKTVELASLKRALRKNRSVISSSRTLVDAANAGSMVNVGRKLIDAAEVELHLSSDILKKGQGTSDIKEGVKERVSSSLIRIEAESTRRMMIGTGVLASIGAIAPFVGLFGTVWGIMNSFIGISEAKTTNLAVVAPGIAEALLATALGLVAAIPAVVIYNYFTRQISGVRALVSDISANVMRLVSRDLDRGVVLAVVKPVKSAAKAAE